jgi:RNA polymerase sigma-70 factor (ECF subfamily)
MRSADIRATIPPGDAGWRAGIPDPTQEGTLRTMNATPSPLQRRVEPPETGPADDDDDDPYADDALELSAEDALPLEPFDGDDASGAASPGRRLAGGLAAAPDEPQLAEWIARIAEHDERALASLYDATLSRVYGLVLRIVRRADLAEEVVEDTYFQVWRQALRFDPARGSAQTWLLGMARSRAIDRLRREARFAADSLDVDDAPQLDGRAEPADELLAAARGHAELHRALMQLQAQPRQLVALAFFRGLSHEEIASQTELPLGTVKSQIRRALIALRQVLGDGAWPARAC